MRLMGLVGRRRDPVRVRARERAGTWLLAQVRPDGGVAGYYKALTALAVCGHTSTAHRLCTWIAANELTADGDFGRVPPDAKGELAIYRNAWIVDAIDQAVGSGAGPSEG